MQGKTARHAQDHFPHGQDRGDGLRDVSTPCTHILREYVLICEQALWAPPLCSYVVTITTGLQSLVIYQSIRLSLEYQADFCPVGQRQLPSPATIVLSISICPGRARHSSEGKDGVNSRFTVIFV